MTELSRRALLQAGALALGALPFTATTTAAAASTTTDLYARSRFTPLLNDAFTLATSTGSWRATLTAVADLIGAPAGDPNRFQLTLTTSVAGPAQQTCTLRRSGFTSTPLFLVPRGPSNRVYDAVINRL
jgi:hypothetical protein